MSKHQRLDAIERRLAYLEANAAGEEQDRILDAMLTRTSVGEPYVDPVTGFPAYPPSGDVRERVAERAALADTHAFTFAETEALRFDASLRALLPMLEWNAMLRAGDSARHLANLHALVAGCLEGGTITPDGWLQRDE